MPGQDKSVVPQTTTIDLQSNYTQEKEQMLRIFEKWPEADQTEFVKSLLSRMSHCQHSLIDLHLGPMLQRDFISLLPSKYLFILNINTLPY